MVILLLREGVPSSSKQLEVGDYNPNYALYLTEMSVSANTNSQDNPSKRAQYFNVDHFYQPDQNSAVGSYLTFDEKVTTKGFDNANLSAKWDSWDMRGASCFLSTSTGSYPKFWSYWSSLMIELLERTFTNFH